MTNNLKIEVLVSNIPEDGSIASQFPSQEYVNQQLAKKANLSPEGRLDPSHAPDYTEIPGLYEHIEDTKDAIETSIADSLQNAKGYTNQQLSTSLQTKADLVNGKIPFDQIPFSADIEEQIQINVENITAVVDQKVAQVVEQVNGVASAANSYTDTKVAENKTYVDTTIGNVIEDVTTIVDTKTVSKAVTIPTYLTPEAGVAVGTGVAAGSYFNVRSSLDDTALVEYQNVGGAPTPTGKSYPSAAYVQNVEKYAALPFVTGKPYGLYERVQLENGDIVKNTIDGNTTNPNVDMTGWGSIGFVSLDSHGAIGNGIVDDMKAFLSAANEAKLTKSVLTATKGKTYKLIGTSGQKLIECSVDLNGAVLDISQLAGSIVFSRGEANKTTYTSGALFDAFKALTAPELSEGNSYLPSLAAFDSLLENSGIIIRTNADFYPYRGEMKKYFEINYYNRGGNLGSGILKTFSASSITAIEVYKQTNIRRVENIIFELKDRSDENLLVSSDIDNAQIRNIQFKSSNINYPAGLNQIRFRLNSGFNTTVENIVFDYPIKNADNTYAYNILLNDLYSVTLKSIRGGDGEGWGVMVTDSPCRKLRIEGCKLNRIDTHYPLLERFESIDNDVGFLGYNILTIGDYIVRGGSVNLEKYSENRKSWGVFNTRTEMGGVCDGKKFHVSGLTINISPRCDAAQFLTLQSSADDVALLSSSMLENKLFDEVLIENITINNKSSAKLGFDRLFPTINTSNPKMKFAKSVTVEKVSGNGFQFLAFIQDIPANIGTALDTSKHYSSLPFTQKITLRDINSPTDLFFVYNSAHMPWNLDINLDNVALPRNISATEIYGIVHPRFFGRLTMNNCKIGYIDYTSINYTYSPSAQPYSLDVIMNSGLLSTRSGIQRGELFVWKGDLLNIKLNGTTILLNDTSEATLYSLAWIDHVNCDFIKPDRSKLTHYKLVYADGANTNFQRMREDKYARLVINTPSSSGWSFDVVCPSKNNPSVNSYIDITPSIKVKFTRNNTTNMIDLEFYVQNANGVYTLNTTSGYSFHSLEIAARQ